MKGTTGVAFHQLVSFTSLESLVQTGFPLFKHNHQPDRPYGVISFPERSRALILRALMPEPRIRILDALKQVQGDIHAREIILSRLDSLTATPDSPALLLVTHRVEKFPRVSPTPSL